MSLRGLIFDFDGTLADTLPVCIRAFREVLEPRLGREVSDAEVRGHFGPSEEGVIQRFVPSHVNECLEAYLHAYERLHHTYPVEIPGITAMLTRFKRLGLSLAVVTAKGLESATISLDHLGMTKYFSLVEVGTPIGEHKLESIGKVVAYWSVDVHDVAYVGDMPIDMRVAKDMGAVPLGAAWLPTTAGDALRRAGAQEVFSRPRALVRWVESQTRARER
jgi:phosphoglycolate phosphatase-like HAD superfamily hydrolase